MNYLMVRNLHKSFAHKVVFDGLDLTVRAGQKVALVAGNGAGKSTLFRCLTNDLSFPEGSVEWYDKISVGWLKQENTLPDDQKVIDVLFDESNSRASLIKEYETLMEDDDFDQGEYDRLSALIEEQDARSYEARVRMIISQLQLREHLDKQVGLLSGGEKKRLSLAKLLLEEPDFMLLDEPTNHLDVHMIEWLENYIMRQNITLLMVTHDRYFLERVCTDIYELEAGEIHCYPGSYSYFLHQKSQRDSQEAKDLHDMKQLYRKELSWMRTAPRARGSKSVYRSKEFYGIEGDYKTARKKFHQKTKGLTLGIQQRRMGGRIMKVEGMQKAFGEQCIVDHFDYEFQQGERIGIVGANGAGKSTFIRMLLQEEPMDAGHVIIGKTIVFGHYTQEHVDFDPSKKVLEVVRDVAEFILVEGGKKLSATKLLERFMFAPKQQHSFVRFLSGGERRRLALLLILLRNPNFLVLDEPTNDLDVQTIQVLEQFLLAYQGCLIVISHDRFFMDKIVDHLFVFEGAGKIRDFWGSYSDYRYAKDEIEGQSSLFSDTSNGSLAGSEEDSADGNDDVETGKKVAKLGYLEQRELNRLGEEIESLEQKKDEINRQFQDPSTLYGDIATLGEDMKKILADLEVKEMRWMELMEKIS